MDDLLRRAYRAYFRAGRKLGGETIQPAEICSGPEEVGGLTYVAMRNNYETLAVYRVRNDGQLKELKRWPRELNYEHENAT